MAKPTPEHLEVLLDNIVQQANETKSLERATHKKPVQVETGPEGTASFVRTPIAGRDEGGIARNATYRGEGSSNATENTGKFQGEVGGTTFNVATVKTYNRGSLGMVDHEKSKMTQLLLLTNNHGKDLGSDRLLRFRLPALDKGVARVKNEVKKDLKAKIKEEVLRCAAAEQTFNPDNIRYMDHRYLGGIANDNEPVSELAYKIAFEEIKKEAGSLVKEVVQELDGKIGLNELVHEAIRLAEAKVIILTELDKIALLEALEEEPVYAKNIIEQRLFGKKEKVENAITKKRKDLKKIMKAMKIDPVIKFNNVVYNNTCLTHGKDALGTSQPSNIPPQVEKMKSEYNKNPGGYEDRVKGEIQTRLTGDPQEWILQAKANIDKEGGITEEIIREMEAGLAAGNNIGAIKEKLGDNKEKIQNAIEYKASDMARQRTCAIKALVAMNEEGGIKRIHHNDHLVSQAAYVNIAMASDGFEVHAGCKSSLDRAGGELTTRTAYENYIRQHEGPPTRENLENNLDGAKFLATQYMSIYQNTTAEIGAQNRFGLDATKTYENFVGSEAKYAMQLRTDAVKGSRDYKDYVRSFAESNMGDEKLLEIALAGGIDEINTVIIENNEALNTLEDNGKLEAIQVAAQNAFNARKIAKDAFTFENEIKGREARSEKDKYDKKLQETINRMVEGNVFSSENRFDTTPFYYLKGLVQAVGAAAGLVFEPITLLFETPNIFKKVRSEMLKRFGENNKNVLFVPALIATLFVTALAIVVRPLGIVVRPLEYLVTKLKPLSNTVFKVLGAFAPSPSIKQSASIVPANESITSQERKSIVQPPSCEPQESVTKSDASVPSVTSALAEQGEAVVGAAAREKKRQVAVHQKPSPPPNRSTNEHTHR